MAEERRIAEPLWRELVGRRLRDLRRERGETLTGIAGRAGISPQYLSEIERGIKEPSSEMIAAVLGALGLTLLELTTSVAAELYAGGLPAVGSLPVPQPLSSRPLSVAQPAGSVYAMAA